MPSFLAVTAIAAPLLGRLVGLTQSEENLLGQLFAGHLKMGVLLVALLRLAFRRQSVALGF